MREHIHWLHFLHLVKRVEQLQVSRLGGRIATHIYNALGGGIHYHLHHIGMHTGAWRVGDYHVGTPMTCDKIIGEDVLHISGKERGVINSIDCRVDLCVLNSLGHILDTYHLTGLAGYKVGYSSCASV